ncbi:hypothetical protein ACXR2T_08095 [Leucobacter sp. HY1910]
MTNSTQARVFEFTKSGSPLIDPVEFQQKSAAALSNIPDGATFIAMRTAQGLRHLLVTDGSGTQEAAAMGVATAVHGHMTELDETPDLSAAKYLGRLWWSERHSQFGSSNMQHSSVSTVAEVAGQNLREGEWVALSVRRPLKREKKWNDRWVRHFTGGQNHQSLSHHVRVISLWAGGAERGAADRIVQAVSAVFPGFGIAAGTKPVSPWRENKFIFATGAAATVGGWALRWVHENFGWEQVSWWPWLFAGGLAILAYGVASVGVIPGVPIAPGPWKKLRTALQWGRVPTARWKIAAPQKPVPQGRLMPDGTSTPARDGAYPLQPEGFLVSAHYPCLVVTPHAGSFSGTGHTSSRPAPPVLRDAGIGIEVGVNEGAPVYLSDADIWSGVFLAGIPGSGKTALVEYMYGQTVQQIAAGKQCTPVALDTKLDGQMSDQLEAWCRDAGVTPNVFHVSDSQAGTAIDLFPRTGPIAQQARRIVDAFVYLYGEQSVGTRSQDTLVRVMTAALTLTPELVTSAQAGPAVNPHGSPFHFAYTLLGGFGDDPGIKLARQLQNTAAGDARTQDVQHASSKLGPLYDPAITPSKRRELCEAPRNKVSGLMTMEHWWAAPEKQGWAEILDAHRPVIVNSGRAPSGEQPSDQQIVEQMSALLVYTLRQAVQDHCTAWQAAGRSVRIFADEVKAIAETSHKVITWFRSDGRAYGVEPVFATQQPAQLITEVRAACMSFGALVAFSQNEEQPATEIAKNLALDGTEWTVQDVTTLPKYAAIVRTTVNQARLPAFTIDVPDFRARRRTDVA